ncbi:MAG: hypothetical protein KDD84_21820 [Caldilineaceae bacterium]|nr:hypothetical protein [Caldilineaceae bacterium]
MKLIHAARIAALTFGAAILVGLFVLGEPLRVTAGWSARSVWLAANAVGWMAGGWLALLAIFTWMMLLVTLIHGYLPAHRVATMLQSGLMIISALLLIGGVIVWMNLLPRSVDATWATFIDGLALTFLGAGLFMGGAVTAWIAFDLARLKLLPWPWVLPGLFAGAAALPAPFLLPNRVLVVTAVACFFVWAVLFAARAAPSAYPEMGERWS